MTITNVITKVIVITILFSSPAWALPDSPIPKPNVIPIGYNYRSPAPVQSHVWYERPETLAMFQGLAVLADGITTANIPKRYHEVDPITRPLIGYHPTMGRMVPLGLAEVGVAYVLAKRWPKLRWLQVGLAATHAGCAGHNLTLH